MKISVSKKLISTQLMRNQYIDLKYADPFFCYSNFGFTEIIHSLNLKSQKVLNTGKSPASGNFCSSQSSKSLFPKIVIFHSL